MGAVCGECGIKRIFLPFSRKEAILQQVKASFPDVPPCRVKITSLVDEFQNYFSVGQGSFSVDLDWNGYSSFSVDVWKAAQGISFGETRTYQWLSGQVGRPNGQRAVGGALGRNPFPLIVPCHRVVRSDGALGGFSAPDGTELKRKLLEHEGVRFDGKGRVLGDG